MDSPFGIVLIRSGVEVGGVAEPYLVGTAVRIVSVHRYDDGRIDIQVVGERRFRVRSIDESCSYLIGHVEPLIELELEDSFENGEILARVRDECEALVQKRFEQQGFSVRVVFPQDPVALSFTIANLLSINNLEKQRLLETTDTLERLQTLRPLLQRQILEAEGPGYFRLSAEMIRDELFPN
jgi:Lon protease-like protein